MVSSEEHTITLTMRQCEILSLLVNSAKTDTEIAKHLMISKRGVAYHKKNLLIKFGIPRKHNARVKLMDLLRPKRAKGFLAFLGPGAVTRLKYLQGKSD